MKFLKDYNRPADLPQKLPVFPLPGALLLPRADLPLNIFEPRYLEMISDALSGERMIGIIQPRDDSDTAERPDLMKVGCAGRITSYAETPDGRMLVTLTGVSRFSVKSELAVDTPYRQVVANFKPFAIDLVMDLGAAEVNRPALLTAFKDYLTANNMSADWSEINAASTEVLVNTLSLLAPYPASEKQALLEAPDLKTRADVLVALTEMALSKSFSGKRHKLQ
ncbi:MAG TPA: LON peptidase substrate-binding domain-containing protein [Aestuariivirga sp.]|jgi:Lon protease-like protein|nr:LON peptidase substrate-binding domain-containing protein [Hyphomicrobiales bacterium]MBZ0259956.1 LON peptidase substrate-binding domain-containing protein [Hyphomicrobiales bacterium]HQX84719.1 LON peptidase substrate-binding domain-containing protein [Aestuariivirga sp.]HQY72492.1 LON peptidase substrate-binding domain-containing protein [Aestuariivirga sp.]HRA93531.1 LON peptidase substrate-binding domain-containing protein [Aestuariivirga sp.]